MVKTLPIKFRWQDKNGRTIYSTLEVNYGSLSLVTTAAYHGEIEEGSIRQLVGYDKNGREVYEGDALQTKNDGTIYAATCRHAKVAPSCDDMSFSEMAKRGGWILKEVAENEVQ